MAIKAVVIVGGLALSLGVVIGFLFALSYSTLFIKYEDVKREAESRVLPEDLLAVLERFTLVNRETGEKLEKFIVLGGAEGVYEKGGALFETFVVAFEDRYGGAEADIDFLDVIIELKWVIGEEYVTVRMVQLGFDIIDVYFDGVLIGSIKPGLEVQVKR